MRRVLFFYFRIIYVLKMVTKAGWILSWKHTVYTCANSLREVNCPPFQHIHITNVMSYSGCPGINTYSANKRLIALCDDKRKCSPDTDRNSSLFHDRFASISFLCKESTDSPVTESTQSTSSDNELDMTTISAAYVTDERTGRQGECVRNTSTMISSLKSDSTIIGVAVGIPVALIVVVGIIIVIVFIRRRYIRKSSDQKFSNIMSKNTDDNYLGQQGIALPQYPTNDRILYSQATNRTDTQGIKGGQGYSHPSKDTQSPYALSEEGVYDKANERRHIVKDTAVYSRAIDTVYDSPEQHTRNDRKEGTYDHVLGQKTEDFYDKTSRT